jgi:uncharacterized protein
VGPVRPLALLALVPLLTAAVPAPTPDDARAACLAAGRTDCDEIASWFEPLPPATAAGALQERCAAGEAAPCFQLGVLRMTGEVPGEYLPLYELACERGHEKACQDIYALTGEAPPGWFERRLARADAGCQAGSPHQCSDAAVTLQLMDPGNWRTPAIEAYWTRGCELGHGTSCLALAAALVYQPKDDAEWARGMNLLDRACQLGDKDACIQHEELRKKGRD